MSFLDELKQIVANADRVLADPDSRLRVEALEIALIQTTSALNAMLETYENDFCKQLDNDNKFD